jgi:hypothetical protein
MPSNSERPFWVYLCCVLFLAACLQWAGQVNIDIDEQHAAMSGSMGSWVVDRHPPLTGFIGFAWAWLTGFSTPLFFLLPKAYALLAVVVIYKLNREFLQPRIALLATGAYTASWPFVSMSLTFDNNAVLHVLWPAAVLFLWRAQKTGTLHNWLLGGLFVGLSLLGKYHSFLLGLSLLLAILAVQYRTGRTHTLQFLAAILVAVAVFLPHGLAEIRAGLPTMTWATASAEGQTNADLSGQGRASIPSFLLGNLAYNMLGAGLLLFLTWREKSLARPVPETPDDKGELTFLVFIGILFPLLPVILSLIFDLSLKTTWGFNAFFLLPTLILWSASKADTDTLKTVSWKRFATLFPLYLILGSALIVANGFRDVARPFALQDALHGADELWSENSNKPIELVIVASEPAVGATFYSRFHPPIKLTGVDPRQGTWLLDEDGCFPGAAAIYWGGPTDWQDALGRSPDFEGLVVAEGRWTNLTYTKGTQIYVQGFPEGLCL